MPLMNILDWIDKDVVEIWNAKKSYIKIFLVILAILPFSCISCHKPIQNVTKQVLEPNKAYVVKVPKAAIGKRIVETINKEHNLITFEQKLDWGFTNKLGVFGSSNLLGWNAGIKYSPFFVGRVYLDTLVGWNGAGIGGSYQVFQNTFAGAGYMYSYNLIPSPQIVFSLNF